MRMHHAVGIVYHWKNRIVRALDELVVYVPADHAADFWKGFAIAGIGGWAGGGEDFLKTVLAGCFAIGNVVVRDIFCCAAAYGAVQ